MEINGIAHIQLTVNDLQRAMPFYEKVLGFMGMKAVVKASNLLYMIGGRTAVAISRSSEENRTYAFHQRRIGLHHICFRARSREDIDALHEFLLEHNVKVVHAPQDGPWAPGYLTGRSVPRLAVALKVRFQDSRPTAKGRIAPLVDGRVAAKTGRSTRQ